MVSSSIYKACSLSAMNRSPPRSLHIDRRLRNVEDLANLATSRDRCYQTSCHAIIDFSKPRDCSCYECAVMQIAYRNVRSDQFVCDTKCSNEVAAPNSVWHPAESIAFMLQTICDHYAVGIWLERRVWPTATVRDSKSCVGLSDIIDTSQAADGAR